MKQVKNFRHWAKHSEQPLARMIRNLHRSLHQAELPAMRPVYLPLRHLWLTGNALASTVTRVFWWTPMFKTRLATPARHLYLFGGMPQVLGSLDIHVGQGCRISGQTTFSGRSSSAETPQLVIGNNVGISWQTTIAVGTRVVLGDNVRIAGRGFLAGYPGHPLDPVARAQGKPDTEDQIGDIVLEQDVWLGSGVTVMKGVTIGRGTIVAAGSVVTQNLPAGVLAGGVPARVIRTLDQTQAQQLKAQEQAA